MQIFRDEVEKLLKKHVKDLSLLEVPPDRSLGDFAYPCFHLAKELKKSPVMIAQDLVKQIKPNKTIEKIVANGSYLNFFIDKSFKAKEVLSTIFKEKEKYGSQKNKQKIIVEYSQPNTHKEFHIGHLRNVCLGSTLINVLRYLGYQVIAANYIGDIGNHVAKSLWCLKKYHAKEKITTRKGEYLGKIYAEANKRIEDDPELKEEVDQIHKKLEDKEKEWYDLWKETREWSLADFNEIYKYLNAPFDICFYESEVEEEGKKISNLLLEKGIAIKDQGAILVDLDEYKLGKFLILKKDGTSLYSTKDLALAMRKFDEFNVDKSIYVVDARQKLYFQQLFKTLELMGFKKDMFHLAYEFVTLPEGAMASRKGNVVLFTSLRDEILVKVMEETRKRHQEWEEEKLDATVKAITLAAMKFEMVKYENTNVVVFDRDQALNLEGETGPYVQYAHARCCSILKKANMKTVSKVDFSLLKEDQESKILKLLATYENTLTETIKHYKPSLLARYALELAQALNEFYHYCKVVSEDKELMKARLLLIFCVKEVLASALQLLVIEPLEEM
ncbi:arginine--tRNA ligase [Candidatus Woesearchaeota archaeon]|nr:arginine--tRNA ligase [Candidatus Woesearchaeota archaeon]